MSESKTKEEVEREEAGKVIDAIVDEYFEKAWAELIKRLDKPDDPNNKMFLDIFLGMKSTVRSMYGMGFWEGFNHIMKLMVKKK